MLHSLLRFISQFVAFVDNFDNRLYKIIQDYTLYKIIDYTRIQSIFIRNFKKKFKNFQLLFIIIRIINIIVYKIICYIILLLIIIRLLVNNNILTRKID